MQWLLMAVYTIVIPSARDPRSRAGAISLQATDRPLPTMTFGMWS